MKITPLEIRQKDFEKKLRGYDKDEVNAFLQSLSNEWERVLEDNKELNIKLQQSEKEVSKLREVETSLYKTLKTAEDTGANVIEQANKAAELHMKETKMNAEALLNESRSKAKAMIEQAEVEARQIIEDLQDAVKDIEQKHRDIENHRDNALQELKNLSVTLIERVEKNAQESKEFKFDDYVKRVKKLARESEERIKLSRPQADKRDENIDDHIAQISKEEAAVHEAKVILPRKYKVEEAPDTTAQEVAAVEAEKKEDQAALAAEKKEKERLEAELVAEREARFKAEEEARLEAERLAAAQKEREEKEALEAALIAEREARIKVEEEARKEAARLALEEEKKKLQEQKAKEKALKEEQERQESMAKEKEQTSTTSDERKGPRIAKTVSFFDELDIDNK